MPNPDDVLKGLFDRMREALEPGFRLSLRDDGAALALILASDRHDDPAYPRFRARAWHGPAGYQVIVRQTGQGADGLASRFTVRGDAEDPAGDLRTILVGVLVAERARLLEYRETPPAP